MDSCLSVILDNPSHLKLEFPGYMGIYWELKCEPLILLYLSIIGVQNYESGPREDSRDDMRLSRGKGESCKIK